MIDHHRCPFPGCPVRVPSAQFACGQHWPALTGDLRREVQRTFFENGAGSQAHRYALEACEIFFRPRMAA